jgi:hypothetical protein
MYSTSRHALPSLGSRPLHSSRFVLAFPSLLQANATRSGHPFNEDFDPIIKSLARYTLNLSENKFISLSEDILLKPSGSPKVDNLEYLRSRYSLSNIKLKQNSSSSSIFWIVQQSEEDDPISSYTKDPDQKLSAYQPYPDTIYVTPLVFDEYNLIPPSIKEIYPDLVEPQIDMSFILPNTWTTKRVNNKNLNLNAENRRLKIGLYQGWVDEDGPISLLPKEYLKELINNCGPSHRTNVLLVKSNSKNEVEFSNEKIALGNYQPGMFIPIRRNVLVINPSSGTYEEVSITQLIHFNTSYSDLDKKENLILTEALDILVKDLARQRTSLENHPILVERYKEVKRFFPNQINTLGKSWYTTLEKINSTLKIQSKYENILLEKKILPSESWQNMNFSKLLVRTESGRNFKRNLNAAQNKEKNVLEFESIYKQHQSKRNQILAIRQANVDQLKELKRILLAKEQEIKNWNNTLDAQQKKLDQVKKDFDILNELALKSAVSQDDILKELGIETLPNIQQIWLRQNWIVLDVLYKNKVSGAIESVSKNKECSLNSNWFLHQVIARTIRPNKIRVGARDPEWETKWGSRVGGPYLFKVSMVVPGDSPTIELFPAEKYTIFGVRPEERNVDKNALRTIKLHPHTAALIINPIDYSSISSMFTHSARVCAGEATTALWQCFQNEDLNLILLTLNSWVSNADPADHWGKEYTYFPEVSEIPTLIHSYSFEEKTFNYVNSTNDTNHLYYQIKYTDGLPDVVIRFGSMIKQGFNWIIPSSGGKTITVVSTPENANAEVEKRMGSILRKGYTKYEGILVNQTAKIEKVLNEQQENNESNNTGTA